MVLKQELAVTVLDDGLRVALDLIHYAKDLIDLGVERRLRAEEDIAVWMGGFVAVIHKFAVGADLPIVARYELQQAQHAALVYGTEHKWRCRFEEAFFNVFAEADEPHREVLRLGLFDLPNVEVDEAHRE